jgi:predicted site-specific integrase-resolvase
MELHEVQKPEMYKAKEVMAFMEISYITLYRLVKSGKLKATNVAKSGKRPIYAFKAEDIQSYYDSLQPATPGNKVLDK